MIIAKVPLRISFTGGGTDLPFYYEQNGGEVIGTAINKFMYVIVKERYDPAIYVNWTQKEIAYDVNLIKHELIREALRIVGVRSAIEVTTLCDIPGGSGLGSSAAVTVGALAALQAFRYSRYWADAVHLAETACTIEMRNLRKPVGKQDPYLCALGGVNHLKFDEKGQVCSERMKLSRSVKDALNQRFMLFYSGQQRSAAQELESQQKNPSALKILGEIHALVPRAKHALQRKSDLDDLGDILLTNHHLKAKLSQTAIPEPMTDALELAIEAGAYGGKMLGAGNGGFLLLYVPEKTQERVRYTIQQFSLRQQQVAQPTWREYPIALCSKGVEVMRV